MKNTLLLIGLILAGAIIGALIAMLTVNTDVLGWLAYSKGVSISPTEIDLVIFKLTFGISFSLSVAQVLCVIGAIIAYPKLKKLIG